MLALLFARAASRGSVLLLRRHGRLLRAKPLLPTALKYASAGLVALLIYLYPIFVAILATLLLHEPITRAKGLALGLALVGLALTVGPLQGQIKGVLFAVVGSVIYSIYIIVGVDVMRHVSAVQSSAVIFAGAAMSAGILMMVNGPHLPATSAGWRPWP